jgi:hypothetical protein
LASGRFSRVRDRSRSLTSTTPAARDPALCGHPPAAQLYDWPKFSGRDLPLPLGKPHGSRTTSLNYWQDLHRPPRSESRC